MFEDSTFESTGRIHTRSRGWMIATFTLNASILLALILIPLLCPEALPRQAIAFLMEAPTPPAPQPPPQPTVRAIHALTETLNGQIFAPRKIPLGVIIPLGREPALDLSVARWEPDSADSSSLFNKPGAVVVHPARSAPVHVTSAVEGVLLLQKTMPIYPPMAKAMRLEGTVVLAATISKVGTIENLRVAGGPAMLQQAALDAVKSWRYRPYLLDGQPVEVETTVNVIFTLSR